MRYVSHLVGIFVAAMLLTAAGGVARAAESPGQADLDKAFEARLSAKSMAEVGQVIELCRGAIKKGLDAENEKLRVAMQTLKEMIFGKRSERLAALVAEQLALALDDLETGAMPPVPANDDRFAGKPASRPRQKARRNIGALPKHLPRCEQVVEPDTTACPCCQGRLHKIGEDVSEVLDVIPAILRVLRTIRPKYGCRSCTDGVVQAKVLPRLIESGMASTALVSHVVVSKFAWYLPLL